MAKKDERKADRSKSASVERDLDPDSAAAYLEYIARGLRERRVVIDGGAELVDSAIATAVGLTVKAKASNAKKRKATIDIHLAWRTPDQSTEQEAPAPVNTTAEEAQPSSKADETPTQSEPESPSDDSPPEQIDAS